MFREHRGSSNTKLTLVTILAHPHVTNLHSSGLITGALSALWGISAHTRVCKGNSVAMVKGSRNMTTNKYQYWLARSALLLSEPMCYTLILYYRSYKSVAHYSVSPGVFYNCCSKRGLALLQIFFIFYFAMQLAEFSVLYLLKTFWIGKIASTESFINWSIVSDHLWNCKILEGLTIYFVLALLFYGWFMFFFCSIRVI